MRCGSLMLHFLFPCFFALHTAFSYVHYIIIKPKIDDTFANNIHENLFQFWNLTTSSNAAVNNFRNITSSCLTPRCNQIDFVLRSCSQTDIEASFVDGWNSIYCGGVLIYLSTCFQEHRCNSVFTRCYVFLELFESSQ